MDLVFLEMFKTSVTSLNDWLTHIPPKLAIQHLGISAETLAMISDANLAILPKS
jgi:oxalate decarboxylase